MRTIIILLLLLIPSLAFGAAFTSTQTGNWNDPATWGGGGFPAAGDTATIATTHIVTVTANAACGTGGATGTDELTIIGTLIVGDFTLTVDGDTQINNGTLQLEPGAIFSIDGTYEIEYSNIANLIANGTIGNRCEISAIVLNNTWIDGAVAASILNIDADFCDFKRFGDGSNRSFDINGSTGTQIINFQNCLFDTFTRWDMYQTIPTSTDYELKFINCDFRNLPSSFFFVIGGGSTWDFDPGTHEINNCTFSGNSSGTTALIRMGSGTNKFLMINNISEQMEWRITNNFDIDGHFHAQGSGLNTPFNCQSPTLNAIVENVINWGDYTNIHLFASAGAGGTTFQDNISFSEEPSGFGNHYLPSEAVNTTTVQRCVTVGDNAVILRSAGASIVNVNRVTHISNNANADAFAIIEAPGYTGTYTQDSCIEYSITPNSRQLFDDLVGPGLGAASSIDFNSYFDYSPASTRYDLLISGKAIDDVGFGASDILADPQFNNKLATIQTWDTSLGGVGTVNNAMAEMLKLNGFDRAGNPATYDTDYNINAALIYFRDAFQPTNTALQGTGQSGVDIGAINLATGGGGSIGSGKFGGNGFGVGAFGSNNFGR